MTIEEATPVIDQIAKSRRKDRFAYYTPDDIFQEVWLMCLDALPRYQEDKGPLVNFLNNHVSRRMKNLRRDKYFRPGVDVVSSGQAWDRINLVNAISLEYDHVDGAGCSDQFNYSLLKDEVDFMRRFMPSGTDQILDDYLTNNEPDLDTIKKFIGG